jgi:hypothetical protein
MPGGRCAILNRFLPVHAGDEEDWLIAGGLVEAAQQRVLLPSGFQSNRACPIIEKTEVNFCIKSALDLPTMVELSNYAFYGRMARRLLFSASMVTLQA